MKDFIKVLLDNLEEKEVKYSFENKELKTIVIKIKDLIITLDIEYGRFVYFSNNFASSGFLLTDIIRTEIYTSGIEIRLNNSYVILKF